MSKEEQEVENLLQAAKGMAQWFEDNMGEELWLRDDGQDGEWVSYLELPEYCALSQALDDIAHARGEA